MINTLRLVRRWQQAGLTPEQASAMVEALDDGLDEGATTKADLRVLQAELRSGIKGEIGSLRNTLLRSPSGMLIAPTGAIVAVARLA